MRHLLLCGLMTLAFAGTAPAMAASDQVDGTSSNTQAAPVKDVQSYLAKIDQMLANASAGTYGDLRRGASKELESARNAIAAALGTRTTFDGLPEDGQLAIQNAEDTISAILRNKEKDRMVCRRQNKTGTRFATSECMTVAQREARAVSAAEATGYVQRENCIPTAENPCGAE